MKNIHSAAFRNRAKEALATIFGALDDATFEEILKYCSLVEILAGEWLFRQNGPGNSLYVLINGRLQAIREQEGEMPAVLGEISRGETVGEMAMFTGETRSASVKAVRDSILAQLSKEDFDQMISRFPGTVLNITRLIIERLKQQNLMQRSTPRYVSLAVLPVSASMDAHSFAQMLFEALKRKNKNVLLLTSGRINQMLGSKGRPEARSYETDRHLGLSAWLDEQETHKKRRSALQPQFKCFWFASLE